MRLSAVVLRVRQWARGTGRRAAWVALIVGALAGAVLSVAGGARRTASVPDRYAATLGGEFDLILYQPAGAPLTEAIRALRGVAYAESAKFVTAYPFSADFETVVTADRFAGDSED